MALKGISNKLVDEIKWNHTKEVKKGRIKEQIMNKENENNSKKILKLVYIGNYVKYK